MAVTLLIGAAAGCSGNVEVTVVLSTPTGEATATATSEATPTTEATPTGTAEATPTTEATPTAEPDPCDGVQCAAGYYCSGGTCVQAIVFATLPPQSVTLFQYCGDDICSSGEDSDSCCEDCGCPSGYYCANGSCVHGNLPFIINPIPIVPILPSTETVVDQPFAYNPAIWGNKIVYNKYVDTEPRIYVYDIDTGTVTMLPHDEDSYFPDIWGGRIVFSDHGTRAGGGAPDIYYYSITEGVEGIISPRPSDYSQDFPKIFNYAVVWQESNYGYLRFYWIASQEERTIYHYSGGGKFTGPWDLWGGYIAYVLGDCSNYPPCEVDLYVYDIATDSTEHILHATSDIKDVAVWGDKIAYISGADNDNLHVYVYDMDTGLAVKLTTVASPKHDLAIYEDRVVWSDERNGNDDIYMYDMAADDETRISSESADEINPDIYGNYIVFERLGKIILKYVE